MSKLNHYNKKMTKGFTLLELLIYMGLFAGFLTILSAFFISTLETQSDASANSSLDADSWYIMSRLQRDAYQANSIVTPANNGEITNTLTLDFVDYQISYTLINDKISITRDGQTNTLISEDTDVANLNFTRLGNPGGSSSINVTADLNSPDGSQTRELNFSLGLRK